MAQGLQVQADRSVPQLGRLRSFLVHVSEWSHKPVIAYTIIAFAISYGFHIIEVRSDHQLAQAIRYSCQRDNVMRDQINAQRVIRIKDKRVVLKPIAKVNCDELRLP